MSDPFKTQKPSYVTVWGFIGGLSSQVAGGLIGAAVMQGVGEPLFAWVFQLYALAALVLIVFIVSVRTLALRSPKRASGETE